MNKFILILSDNDDGEIRLDVESSAPNELKLANLYGIKAYRYLRSLFEKDAKRPKRIHQRAAKSGLKINIGGRDEAQRREKITEQVETAQSSHGELHSDAGGLQGSDPTRTD